jgi:tetratricopeptide (TPR) repeat protein
MNFQWIVGALAFVAVSACGLTAQARSLAPQSHVIVGGSALSVAEAEDLAVYDGAMAAFQTGGFEALGPWLPKLQRALDRAPASYPAIERIGDRVIVRASDLADALMLSALAATGPAGSNSEGGVEVVTQSNVYPLVALMLGSVAVETQDYRRAIALLDRGLALQPMDRLLLTEKLTAMQGLGQWEEALALADAALASGDLLLSTHLASLHRKRGFSLIELGRLDEAEAAYRESLMTEPDNAAAKQELEYIAGLRRGRPRGAPEFVAPGAQPSGG